MDLFSDHVRQNPFPAYGIARRECPVFHVPPPFDAWMVFDYATVKAVLSDHGTFSSRVPGPPWFIFSDPPEHLRLRGLISRAFTPRTITNLDARIRQISKELLDAMIERPQKDLATDYSVPLPMRVIAEMIGIPADDWPRYRRWSDSILKISYARGGGPEAQAAMSEFTAVTGEMGDYLIDLILRCRANPGDDLLTRLVQAELDGQKLSHAEILGFFQLLVVGGQETTVNLINNAVLCLASHPDQLTLLRERPELLGSAIEEVLRFRSPIQWLMRAPTRDIEVHGNRIPTRSIILTMIGSANRDEAQFPSADRFDITRQPNAHLAFGHGAHFCMGAALSRVEAKIALTDLLQRTKSWHLPTADSWPPRQALHVHGPQELPIQFEVIPGQS
jgi:cytochrome P450